MLLLGTWMSTKFKQNITFDISARLCSLQRKLLPVLITLYYIDEKTKVQGYEATFAKAQSWWVTGSGFQLKYVQPQAFLSSLYPTKCTDFFEALSFGLKHIIILFIIPVYYSLVTVMFSSRLSMWNQCKPALESELCRRDLLSQEYWFSLDINSYLVSWAPTISVIPAFSRQISGSLFKQQVLFPLHPSISSWPLPFDFPFRWIMKSMHWP